MCKERLAGLTKAAKESNGNSRKCSSCPLVEKLPLRCTPEISKICSEAHIECFKKGASFAIKTKKRNEMQLIDFHSKKYGTEIVSRLEKLSEETQELTEAIAGFTMGDNGIAEVKDEMGDVLSVMLHVCSIIGTDFRELMNEAYDKVQGREKNPNYKRNHPHK